MDDMLETMYAAPGIGLAAVQIGILKRAIVIDLSKEDEKRNPLFFVNPEITFKSKELVTYEEGCLSVPNQFAEVDRPATCEVEYLDYNGEKKLLKAKKIEFFVVLSALIIFSQAHYTHRHPLIWFLFVMIVMQSINSETKVSKD